jgi:hypothetical protein
MSQNVNYNEVTAFQPFAVLSEAEVEIIESVRETRSSDERKRKVVDALIAENQGIKKYRRCLVSRITGSKWGDFDEEAEELLNGGLKAKIEDEDEF